MTKPKHGSQPPGDAADAIEQAEGILELIEDDLPDRAWDKAGEFFEDVQEKVKSVLLTLQQTGVVTPRQQSALDSWEAAIRKWIH